MIVMPAHSLALFPNDTVAVASTLQQVRDRVEAHQNPWPWRARLLAGYLRFRTTLANALLCVLQSIMFVSARQSQTAIRNIVIYTVGILGDNLVMLPAMAAIRKRFPKARIVAVVNTQTYQGSGATGVLGGSPWIDRVYAVNDALVSRIGWKLHLDRGQIPEVRCDLFVNLSPFGNRGWLGAVLREIALARLLGARYAIGFKLHTLRVLPGLSAPHRQHFMRNEPRRPIEVLRPLGITPDATGVLPIDWVAAASVEKKLRSAGIDERPFAVLHPGAKFAVKCWPADRFGQLARWLSSDCGYAAVVTGSGSEQQVVRAVTDVAGVSAVDFYAQTTVNELIELVRRAKVCVTNDTGTLHIAALLGIPTVALFSTRVSPALWFPKSANLVALFKLLECSYCQLENDDCSHRSCMTGITLAEVCTAVKQVLRQPLP